jgi:hypothetical protein
MSVHLFRLTLDSPTGLISRLDQHCQHDVCSMALWSAFGSALPWLMCSALILQTNNVLGCLMCQAGWYSVACSC